MSATDEYGVMGSNGPEGNERRVWGPYPSKKAAEEARWDLMDDNPHELWRVQPWPQMAAYASAQTPEDMPDDGVLADLMIGQLLMTGPYETGTPLTDPRPAKDGWGFRTIGDL